MEQNAFHKAKELIEKNKKILLVTRSHPTDDSIGSIIALGLVLEKMGKEIDLVCQGPIMSNLSFLPKHGEILPTISEGEQFIITLDTSHSKVSQFTYDFDDDGNKLNIYITPEGQMFDVGHVSALRSGAQYDLIIIVDAKDLEILGGVYEKNAKVFFETPIVNIDCSFENEQYGEVNCIDVKANASAEVVYLLIQAFGESYFDENIATSLLAGIISKTKSFQSRKTNPKAFSTSAKLIQHGADQQKIVHNLFKNKSLKTLKLWGRMLLGASYDEHAKIVTATVHQKDFEETGTGVEHVSGFEEELLASVREVSASIVFVELRDAVTAYVRFDKENDADMFARVEHAHVSQGVVEVSRKNTPIIDVQQSVLGAVKSVLVGGQ